MEEQRFLLVRGMISLAQVDGKYTDDEDQIIRERTRVLGLTVEQKRILDEDRRDPVDPLLIYERMPDLTAKGLYLSAARNLFHADGEFCQAEQAVMAKLEAIHEKALLELMPGLRTELQTVRKKANIEIMDARIAQSDENQNPLAAVFNWMFRN